MQRVRKIIEKEGLIVVEVDQHCSPGFGSSNAMYLLEYHEYGQHEHDAAIGKALREHAEEILYGPSDIKEEAAADGTG